MQSSGRPSADGIFGNDTRLEAKIDHVDEKLGNFENHEIDKRLQLEVHVERLEKQRS